MLLGDRVRWDDVELRTPAGDEARALVVAVRRESRTTLLGRGDASAAVALVEEWADLRGAAGLPRPVDWMSVPRGADVPAALLAELGLARFSSWDWMATDREPPAAAAEPHVVVLEPARDADAIRACLEDSNPGTTADPTGPQEAAWFGVRDGGRLVGVAGASLRGGRSDESFSWHLHGLGVRPGARARGLGAALTAAVTRAGLAGGAQWVSLGMYADNDAARRIYRRLGFLTEGRFASFGPAGADRPPT